MDSFALGAIFWVVCMFGAFSVGKWWPLDDMVSTCNKDGEYTARSTVIQCKPIATIIDGKRITLKE